MTEHTKHAREMLLLANQLADNLKFWRMYFGRSWEEQTKITRITLLAKMAAQQTKGALETAVPMAREMSKAGMNPLLLLAVAADLDCQSRESELPILPNP